MGKRTILWGAVAALLFVAGCKESGKKDGKSLPESIGTAYEVFVFSPKAVWESSVGDTLKAVLLEPVPMLNQTEPFMDVVSMQPGVSQLNQRHRNMVEIEIGAEYDKPEIRAAYDVYAQPQIVVYVTGPDDKAVTDYIWERRAEIARIFEMAERDRYVDQAIYTADKKIGKQIREMFGFEMAVPRGYMVRNALKDFLWLSYEWPTASQGIVIYSYPYTGKNDFTADSLLAERNRFVALIPGPADSSYMTTADIIDPEVNYMRIEGRPWAEMRGFWDVKGDFMGGPFRSYTTLDSLNNRMVCIDTYVFSPKNRKRNYVRQLENLVYTVKFPEDE